MTTYIKWKTGTNRRNWRSKNHLLRFRFGKKSNKEWRSVSKLSYNKVYFLQICGLKMRTEIPREIPNARKTECNKMKKLQKFYYIKWRVKEKQSFYHDILWNSSFNIVLAFIYKTIMLYKYHWPGWCFSLTAIRSAKHKNEQWRKNHKEYWKRPSNESRKMTQ